MARACGVLCILTCKCASRRSGVPFFQIGSAKIGPSAWCFAHFDLQMRFAPQWRTIFPDPNCENRSRTEVFCTFWLANVLRATVAYHFSGSELPKLPRDSGVLCILTCKCASRHSGVPFLICLLNSYLRTRRFSEPISNIRNHESLKEHSDLRHPSQFAQG